MFNSVQTCDTNEHIDHANVATCVARRISDEWPSFRVKYEELDFSIMRGFPQEIL